MNKEKPDSNHATAATPRHPAGREACYLWCSYGFCIFVSRHSVVCWQTEQAVRGDESIGESSVVSVYGSAKDGRTQQIQQLITCNH